MIGIKVKGKVPIAERDLGWTNRKTCDKDKVTSEKIGPITVPMVMIFVILQTR